MSARVTIQDIADALGLSRNTVSKAINNTGTIADATRERILQKAVEMGYKQFSYVSLTNSTGISAHLTTPADTIAALHTDNTETPINMAVPGRNFIALFTTLHIGNSHFSSTMMDKLQRDLSCFGYTLVIHYVSKDNLVTRTLPVTFDPSITAGIICIEMFNAAYNAFLCELNLPTLFVDGPVNVSGAKLNADYLLMDNRTNIYALVHELHRRGFSRFGFVGKVFHCTSFFERYTAFREALIMLDIPYDKAFSITEMDRQDFTNDTLFLQYLKDTLSSMSALPEVFICANDFVAVDVMRAMRELGITVPEDVCICGFDDSPESRIIVPPLTTVHIHSQIMGYSAVSLLLSRIREPSLNSRTLYTETSLIYRASTRD